jgi:hypothetical protein
MFGLYYRIWVDCMTRVKLQPSNRRSWKLVTMMVMSPPNILNFVVIMTILQRHVFHDYFYKLDIPVQSKYWGNALSFLVLFVLPCIVFNYLLIFGNGRYTKLLERYPYHNGKLFLAYFLLSLVLPMIVLVRGIMNF